jgi:isopentenyl phosphate kinase
MPVGPSASGPLRAGLEAILAKRGEVEYEVDTVDDSLAKVVAPVEHGPQTMDALGRNICSARDVAEALGDGPETA